jgi:hypothetical protein
MKTLARSPWGAVLDELLADGDWHSGDELIAAMVAAIPPGVAYRAGEKSRTNARRWGTPGARKFGDQETAVAAGARRLASSLLAKRVSRATVERDGDRYRRRSP